MARQRRDECDKDFCGVNGIVSNRVSESSESQSEPSSWASPLVSAETARRESYRGCCHLLKIENIIVDFQFRVSVNGLADRLIASGT
jgi:hypothetical protein